MVVKKRHQVQIFEIFIDITLISRMINKYVTSEFSCYAHCYYLFGLFLEKLNQKLDDKKENERDEKKID